MDSTEDRIRKVIVTLMGVEPDGVKRESSLVADLGADSLERVELVMAVEDEFAIEIPDEDAEPLHTVGQIIDYVETRLAVKSVAG